MPATSLHSTTLFALVKMTPEQKTHDQSLGQAIPLTSLGKNVKSLRHPHSKQPQKME